jgi:hypothetical protein
MDKAHGTDIDRKFYPTAAEYTFFANTQRTFFKIDYALGHKTSLNQSYES